jgi:hypothetical protein
MQVLKPNLYSYIGYGGKNDVHMSAYDYMDFVRSLREDNVSVGTALKFKHASKCNNFFFFS